MTDGRVPPPCVPPPLLPPGEGSARGGMVPHEPRTPGEMLPPLPLVAPPLRSPKGISPANRPFGEGWGVVPKQLEPRDRHHAESPSEARDRSASAT